MRKYYEKNGEGDQPLAMSIKKRKMYTKGILVKQYNDNSKPTP